MNPAMALGLLLVLGTAVLGWAAVRNASRWRAPAALVAGGRRGRVVLETSVEQLGRVVTAVLVVLAGSGFAIAGLWALGWPIKLTERAFDVPVFEWFQAQRDTSPSWWRRLWLILTNIGGLNQTQALTVVFAVGLAVLWRRQRWWVPLTVLPVGYVLEKTLQDLLKLVVNRGHPPTSLGSFPSGGNARVILVYGLIVFLVLRWRRTTDRRVWVAGAAVVALCAAVQAYARTFNLEHWVTDVGAGLLLGAMLLATMAAAVWVLDRDPTPSAPRPLLPHRRGDGRVTG